MKKLRVVILKPSKYGPNGHVERFRWGFMPNSTVPYLRSMTPRVVEGHTVETFAIDEYVQSDLDYLKLLHTKDPTLLAIVGVQSHQLHRSLDLAAYARRHGIRNCIIGGPHCMTCDTAPLQNRGVSFSLAEAEMVWPAILSDAANDRLQPVYGEGQRWQQQLDSPVLTPPSGRDLRRYIVPMLGVYPARGCPFNCNFCSVIKIAGRKIRSQPLEITLASLRAARAAGIRLIMFVSDNFNKYQEAAELLQAMIDERIRIPFFVQCDTQIAHQPELVDLLARAGCFQIFLGVESFNRKTLRDAKKYQNHPEDYTMIVALCRSRGIGIHFSNIIGFPDDTGESVLEHLHAVQAMAPDVASFYILTPIPGTEQYDDFLAADLITETNLDRYDGSCPTWRHPHLRPEELRKLLFYCYRKFYSTSHVIRRSLERFYRKADPFELLITSGCSFFSRLSAFKQVHPMSGGIARLHLDGVLDYIDLRRELFGFTHAPLPKSLRLSPADESLNRLAKL
ncbi:MAG TPA: radical SAM protein [Acidobacteriota bacterium]